MEIKTFELEPAERGRFHRSLVSIADRIFGQNERIKTEAGAPTPKFSTGVAQELREIAKANLPPEIVDEIEHRVVHGNGDPVVMVHGAGIPKRGVKIEEYSAGKEDVPSLAMASLAGTSNTYADNIFDEHIMKQMDLSIMVLTIFASPLIPFLFVADMLRIFFTHKLHTDQIGRFFSVTAKNPKGRPTVLASIEEVIATIPDSMARKLRSVVSEDGRILKDPDVFAAGTEGNEGVEELKTHPILCRGIIKPIDYKPGTFIIWDQASILHNGPGLGTSFGKDLRWLFRVGVDREKTSGAEIG